MPEQETFYYAGGRKIPLQRDPERYAVRYREPEVTTRSARSAVESEREEAERAAGAVERVEVPRRNLVILRCQTVTTRNAEGKTAHPEDLAHRSDVEFVTPVYRETTQGLQLIPTDEFNVRFKPDVTPEQIAELNAQYDVEIVRQSKWSPQEYILRVTNPQERSVIDVANAYYESGLTEWAEPNFLTEGRKHFLPNDPLLAHQWHLENTGQGGGTAGEDVHAQEAWDITRGDPDITIAILDDGVDVDHPDLAANIHPAGYDFFDDDDNPRPRYFAAPYNETNDNDIHGTPCAGVAAACGNNGTGVAGIAYQCRILPIKIWGAPSLAPNSVIADSIRYAAQHAAVLSGSWSSAESDTVRQAIEDVSQHARNGRGVLVFFSSGNDPAWRGRSVAFPARVDAAIAVGASTNQGRRSGYSNYGPELDFVAPSNGGTQGIWTTDVSYTDRGYNLGDDGSGGDDGLYTNSFGGTSSACPLAAGVGALVLSVRPDLPAALVRRILRETCDKIGNRPYVNGRNDEYGWGRINAHRAVSTARFAPIGNRRSKEMHRAWCPWARRMADHNKVYFLSVEEGLDAGYNGCWYCLRPYDTG
ncbi:MAG: S8 family serine peptidase [Chloroflexi bacterium]|nr:S8 family serine peptidase [Chloroflexota bacterium]